MSRDNSLLTEVWYYLRVHRRWWLIPLLVVFAFFALALTISEVAPVLSPFIYTLF